MPSSNFMNSVEVYQTFLNSKFHSKKVRLAFVEFQVASDKGPLDLHRKGDEGWRHYRPAPASQV